MSYGNARADSDVVLSKSIQGEPSRWGRDWVKVLPLPNRYPQGMELLEMQQVVQSRLLVHTTPYEVVGGIRATFINNLGSTESKILSISSGTIWSAIGYGTGMYIDVPSVQVVVPSSTMQQLGIQIISDLVTAGYDPILGGISPLLWEAPLDRIRLYIRYVWNTPDALPILTIKDRVIHYYSSRKNPLRSTLIEMYMRELDGDYIAQGVVVTYLDGWVNVASGRAWVGGRCIEVYPQSIPYREGLLQLCADGSIVVEVKHEVYFPDYSVVVSSDGVPINMGGQYGVVLPTTTTNPYLIANRCIPLASLDNGQVVDVAARLPTNAEILQVLSSQQSTASSQGIGDTSHPLYRVRVEYVSPNGDHEPSGVIYLPRTIKTLSIPSYIPLHTQSVIEESTLRTDWVDSAPTPSTPPPPPPFVTIVPSIDGHIVYGYNLTPSTIYLPNPAPAGVLKGTAVGLSISTDAYGMLEYVSTSTPIDLSSILPTTSPQLSLGLGQSFRIQSPVMIGSVSLYLRAGYHGVVTICALQNNQPHGPALAWVGVSSTSTGWLDIQIGPIYVPPGTYALISQSVVGSVIGRRHYLLPTLSGTPETTGSMNMLLSQDTLWQSLQDMDLMYRIHAATPTATYRDRFTSIEWGEAFDGYEYKPNYHLAPGTYITCTASNKQGGVLLGKVFPPRTTITLSEALFSTDTLFPIIGDSTVQLHISSKTGTWVSREKLVGPYTSVKVTLKAQVPEGSTVSVFLNSANGWLQVPLLESVVQHGFIYQVGGLSSTTSSTDINGGVRQVIRERVRIRIDLNTLSPELQPYVWGVEITTQ